ncbi:hypothetical protein BDV28DRAFT_28736 [Aspergillus coremiiformis]|uniref:Letm1 RBD domain-containing protein n=1 Tax=Aspergillus coremiiformis TaxID=138285 RepID=A0A5N6YZW4_9EURO|nr:hypothetical protein BDV28DRAFT_28736 [Aspergillus coremiiformis]
MSSLCTARLLIPRYHPLFSTPIQSQRQRCDINFTSRGYASPSKTHTRPSSAVSSTATTTFANDVNPPPSTRPADLNLPDAISPSASTAEKLFRFVKIGRAYLSFYKTGLKNVYHNYRASLPIRRSLGLPPYLPISPPPAPSSSSSQDKQSVAFRKTILSAQLSRSNFQLVRRAAYDVQRMIPFTLILIICGEMTPIVVTNLPSAVTPFTCRVPRQTERDHSQRMARKRAALIAQQAATGVSVTPPATGSDEELVLLVKMYTNPKWIERATAEEVLRACAVLNLVHRHTRHSGLASLYRRKLQRYAEYLRLDDWLIRRCGGVWEMEAAEVKIAVEERGGVGVAEKDERQWLEKWLMQK